MVVFWQPFTFACVCDFIQTQMRNSPRLISPEPFSPARNVALRLALNLGETTGGSDGTLSVVSTGSDSRVEPISGRSRADATTVALQSDQLLAAFGDRSQIDISE